MNYFLPLRLRLLGRLHLGKEKNHNFFCFSLGLHYLCTKIVFIMDIKELCAVDCFWLAGGKWPIESLANFYVVEISENAEKPENPQNILLGNDKIDLDG